MIKSASSGLLSETLLNWVQFRTGFLSRLFLASVFLCGFMLTSCKWLPGKAESSEKAVARVYDKYLYPADLIGVVPSGTPENDSIDITTAYINNWIRQELLLKQAEDNLDDANRDFSRQIAQYRNSLIIYAYESELVKQKLDTVVAMPEIEEYYEKNKDNFYLRENIVLASYVKMGLNLPVASRIKSLLVSTRDTDKEKLETLCQENNLDYYINDGSWMSFAWLTSKVPLSVDDQIEFLNRNKYVELKDSTTMYYVAIAAYKSKESISPLNFEIDNIKAVILNKRKAELLKRMEEDLMSEAVKKSNFEILKK